MVINRVSGEQKSALCHPYKLTLATFAARRVDICRNTKITLAVKNLDDMSPKPSLLYVNHSAHSYKVTSISNLYIVFFSFGQIQTQTDTHSETILASLSIADKQLIMPGHMSWFSSSQEDIA